jgi:thiol:disulfide interchange protein DsbA
VKQDIKAVYIPVVWSDTTELHAKAFYLIQDKPEFKTLHAGLFKLVAGFSRTDSLEEQKIALIDWFQKQGIQPIDTLQALDSSQFEQELANSLLLTKRFKVTGTPALVVNQKYRINNDALTSQQEMLSVAEGLMK